MTTTASGSTSKSVRTPTSSVRLTGGRRLTTRRRPRRLVSRLAAALLIVAGILPARALPPNALPTGGSVASGGATIATSGSTMNVNQSTANVIINWGTFNIGANATVNFRQPGESSVALNRVAAGAGASEIAGHLNANGQVFLVNPDGILFSRTARVDVGGLVASTLGISDSNFNGTGNKVFSAGANAGSITNLGRLHAGEEGYVALLAPTVSNEGTISAQLGTVALAAGSKITLSFDEEQLVSLTINRAALDTLVENHNVVRADGGLILMTAGAAGSLASSAVNSDGLLQANRVTNHNGVIRLEAAGADSSVSLAGELRAQDGNAFAKATAVAVAGDTTADAANLTLDGRSLSIDAALDLGGTATNLGLVAGYGGIGGAGVLRMGSGTLSLYTDAGATLTTENLGTLAGYGSDPNAAISIVNTGSPVTIGSGSILLDPNHADTRYEISGFDGMSYYRRGVLRDAGTNQSSLTLINLGGDVTVAAGIASAGDVALLTDGGIAVNAPIDAANALALGASGDIGVDARLDGGSIILVAEGTANFSPQAQLASHGDASPQPNPNDALVVAARVFNNQRGADLFSTQPGTRWLVYSEDPAANTKGGLVADFKRYDCAFGSCTAMPDSGNGFLYSIAPVLVVTPDGIVATYGDVHVVPDGHGYTVSGFIDGDTAADVTGTASYQFAADVTERSRVGSYDVQYVSGLASELGYRIVDNAASTGEYVIAPRALHVTATADSKVYDGTTAATAALSDDRLAGDVLSSSFGAAAFDDKNAGSGKTVTVSGIAIGGADAGNYVVATNTDDGTVATATADIGRATLTVAGATGVNKIFDNTTRLPAAAGNGYAVLGLVPGDDVAVSAGAVYDSAQPGARSVVVSGAVASGGDAGNYDLVTANGSGTIAPLDLTSLRPPGDTGVTPGNGNVTQPADAWTTTPTLASGADFTEFINSLPPTGAGPGEDDCQGQEVSSPLITISKCGIKLPEPAEGER